jgi:hypothetical protein
MLGYSPHEVGILESFANNAVNRLCARTAFTDLVIGVASCIYDDPELLKRVRTAAAKLFYNETVIHIVRIDGGPRIGYNRYQTITGGIDMNDTTIMQSSMAMFMDIDDSFTNPTYWREIRSELTNSAINVMEVNFVSENFKLVRPEDYDLKRFVTLDPWDPRNYDPITGYYYYNPRLRTSSTNKIFRLSILDLDILKSWDRYEDSLIYADMYAKLPSVTVAPYVGILYNRSQSSILTDEASEDEILLELQNECLNPKYLYTGSPVPYMLLHDQIKSWRDSKKRKSEKK